MPLALAAGLAWAGVPPVGAEIEISAPNVLADSIWYEPPVPGLDSPEARAYAAEAALLSARDPDFSHVFAGLCRLMRSDPRKGRSARTKTADLFRGLIRWTRAGAAPSLQGREDWALHFVYGGYLSAVYGRTTADAAALAKEERDAITPGNAFDLDDWAVTRVGARWADEAAKGRSPWLDGWANGTYRLDRVPKLTFGKLPRGVPPDVLTGLRVTRFVESAF